MKFLHESIKELELPILIDSVVSDRTCGALDFARQKDIANFMYDFSSDGWEKLSQFIQNRQFDVIITNFHRIIPSEVLKLLPNRFLNLHYSLLPSFKGMIGMKTVDLAKEQNVQIIGATSHIVNEKVDGGFIIAQGGFTVDWNLEMGSIYNTMFQVACKTFLNALLCVFDISFQVNRIHEGGELYQPKIRYDYRKLDEDFWRRIK